MKERELERNEPQGHFYVVVWTVKLNKVFDTVLFESGIPLFFTPWQVALALEGGNLEGYWPFSFSCSRYRSM